MFSYLVPILSLALTVEAIHYIRFGESVSPARVLLSAQNNYDNSRFEEPSTPAQKQYAVENKYKNDKVEEAASPAQIRFALENKYDDTGPGAKGPEYAYTTFKNLDDAIFGYLEDIDTKLPQKEKIRAVERLLQRNRYQLEGFRRYYPKTVEEYTGFKATQPTVTPPKEQIDIPRWRPVTQLNQTQQATEAPNRQISFILTKLTGKEYYKTDKENSDPFRFSKVIPVRVNPLSLAHYIREPERQEPYHYNPYPKYSFSYRVHEAKTGDFKKASESREGGAVKGFYSYLDADGKHHIVHYTADDKEGFKAVVERVDPILS